jgi:alkanesulfonate monooxygenase SsuD/methylene tetrahydromethanopterin reductase-like flavin-dependent oxidoreductase (luciferase family)
MIESAGRVADGLLGHTLFSPAYISGVVRPALARGAARAGREVADVKLATYTLAACSADEEQARRDAAAMIGFYGSVKSYGGMLEAVGFGAEAKAIQAAFAARDVDGMVGAVTDAMVDELSVAGTPAQVVDKLRRFDGVVDEVVLTVPSFRTSPERVAENLALLTAHCGPRGSARHQETTT